MKKMGKSWIHDILISCTLLVFMIGFTSGDHGFSIKMTRKDSLFPENLSLEEKHERIVNLSYNRSHYLRSIAANEAALLSKNTTGVGPEGIRPRVEPFASSIYAVLVEIGSQPYKTYLDIDTGSELSWVQCKGCNGCFQIKGGPFDPQTSRSYAPMAWNDPLCFPPVRDGNSCALRIRYVSAYVNGMVARETLTFTTDTSQKLSIDKLVIGCATATNANFKDNAGPENLISGIFALATGPNAFLELAKPIVGIRFSYCLPRWNAPKGAHTFLRFGNDIPPLPRGFQSTPMQTRRFYLNVVDITFFQRRLRLNPEWFKQKPDGSGGFAVDSGSANTFLVADAYQAVKSAFESYFFAHGMRPMDTGAPNKLCYRFPLPNGMNLPTMTYHLEGADLLLDFWRIFQNFNNQFMCMMILPTGSEGTNLLGAFQQADNRFIFDLKDRRLYFFPEQCGGA